MTALLLDQGLPRSALLLLQERGWTAEHVGELGMSRSSDREILDYAREHQLTIVTLDADFHAILAVDGATRPTVIRIRHEGLRGEALVRLLIRIWPDIQGAISNGALVTVTDSAVRIRRLPIGGADRQ